MRKTAEQSGREDLGMGVKSQEGDKGAGARNRANKIKYVQKPHMKTYSVIS